ncbi:MAG TPA: hypothetical protein VGL38_14830 [bacterium]|jgi:hypothetical protein
MTGPAPAAPSAEDHEKAMAEVSFLLGMFAATIDDLMGGATSSVSRIAGRHMARKLPIHLEAHDLESVLQAVTHHFRGGFDITCACREGSADLTIAQCAIRDVCHNRGLKPGGPLCTLFHSYFDGVINELHYRPTKSEIRSAGDVCTAHMVHR